MMRVATPPSYPCGAWYEGGTKEIGLFTNPSIMEGAGSAERSFSVGFLAAIATNKCWILLQSLNFLGLPGLGQFTDVQAVILRVGTKVIYVNQSVAHEVISSCLSAAENIRVISNNQK